MENQLMMLCSYVDRSLLLTYIVNYAQFISLFLEGNDVTY